MKYQLSIVFLLMSLFTTFVKANIPFYKYPQYFKVAEKLADQYNLKTKGHSILIHNLTFYLRNYISPKELNKISKLNKKELLGKVFKQNFWAEKLERDLNLPYTDAEFKKSFAGLQKELQNFLRFIKFINVNHHDIKITLYGSFVKGRFGANSSLDIWIDADCPELQSKIQRSVYSKKNPDFKGNIEVITSSFPARFLLTPFKKVTPEQLEDIYSVYNNIQKSMGFVLNRNKKEISVKASNKLKRIHMEFNPIEDRVYYLCNKLDKVRTNILKHFQNSKNDKKNYSAMMKVFQDFDEVRGDLNLIRRNINNKRHKKIKEVIAPASYERMINHRAKKILKIINRQQKEIKYQMEFVR